MICYRVEYDQLFLVGHAVVAFLIAYIICKIFKINRGVSFALAMLIGTIPDIDIITQALGIMPHKTFTHSLIVSAGIGSAIFLTARVGFKQASAIAIIYALAYLQHLMDDVVIGTLNILYPIGNLPVGIGINYGSVTHEVIEFLLLAVVASITISKSFRSVTISSSGSDATALFRFFTIDKVGYVLLLLSLLVSFGYLLHELKSLPHLTIETDLETALFVLLHLSAITWVLFTMLAAKHNHSTILKKSAISSKRWWVD